MYDPKKNNALAYTEEQARRHRLWLVHGDGTGHHRRKCEACGEVFYSVQRDARYCDRRCYEWGYRNPPKDCPRCGRTFRNAHRKWCSDSCRVSACRERRAARLTSTKKLAPDDPSSLGRELTEPP